MWDSNNKTILNGHKVTLREVLLYMIGKNARNYSEANLLERYRREPDATTPSCQRNLFDYLTEKFQRTADDTNPVAPALALTCYAAWGFLTRSSIASDKFQIGSASPSLSISMTFGRPATARPLANAIILRGSETTCTSPDLPIAMSMSV